MARLEGAIYTPQQDVLVQGASQASQTTRKRRAGNAVVEMAIVFPLMTAIFAGVVDFSQVILLSVQMNNAAQVAALWASQSVGNSGNTTQIATIARNDAALGTALTVTSSRTCTCSAGGTVSCTASGSSCSDGKSPKVTVHVADSYTLDTILPIEASATRW